VSVPYRRATKLPAEISYRTAAGLPNAGITAYDIVFGALKDVSFSKVLIIGASGAVGTNLYQILNSLNKQVSVVINSKYTEQFDTADFNQVVFYDAPKTIEQLGLYDVIINVAPQNELADLYLA
ncbi:NADP-dependent oxidoreductase, partial [Enterococcus faecium]|nr:NADP-dependent oxidoreductase [Enterococcus faecium]